jgi:MYXO-CTERM domain-containing protein
MSDPRTGGAAGTADDVDPVIEARERAVEQHREQLAHTIDALHDKLDVKAHAHDAVQDAKAHARDTVRNAKAQATTRDGRPRPVVLAAVAGLVVVTALVVWRRRR